MIPKIISREDVQRAISDIRANGIPKKREPTRFNLVYEERLYPPKYVLSLAAKYATGQELSATDFSGGKEANSFLAALGFEIQAKRGDWSWKECYFAVWGYDQLDLYPEQVIAVLCREIAKHIGRTAGAVEYKLQNTSSFDPRPRDQKPIAEARNAQRLLGEVFRWYWADRPSARALFAQIRQEFYFGLRSTTTDHAGKIEAETTSHVIIEEGASASSPATRRKRSQILLNAGRKHFRQNDSEGKLRCHACGFVTPAELDAEIIHLHHTQPISEIGAAGRALILSDALRLLVPLCPTCHSLAHSSRPPLSVARIKELF